MEGYDLDLFSEHKTDDAIVTAETEADPEKPTANEGYKNPKADFDDPVDLSGGRFIPVGDSGILYAEAAGTAGNRRQKKPKRKNPAKINPAKPRRPQKRRQSPPNPTSPVFPSTP